MNVFSAARLSTMEDTLRNIFARVIAAMPPPQLTEQEFLDAIVLPEHRKLIEDVQAVVGEVQTHSNAILPITAIDPDGTTQHILVTEFRFSRQLRYILPAYAKSGFRVGADPEVVARVTKWASWRYAMGRNFSLITRVLWELDDECDNPQQVRFFFPGVLALMTDESLEPLADKLRAPRTPSRIPNLHPDLRASCAEATKILSRAALAPSVERSAATEDKGFLAYVAPYQVQRNKFYVPWNDGENLIW